MSASSPLNGSAVDFTAATLDDLTDREREVLVLITNGFTNQQVAERLFISINSVKTYVRSTYRKIGAETRAHALVWGVRHGLLEGVPATAAPPDTPSHGTLLSLAD